MNLSLLPKPTTSFLLRLGSEKGSDGWESDKNWFNAKMKLWYRLN